jgi:hypothetical protein
MQEKTTTSGQPLQAKPFATKPTIIPRFIDGVFTGQVCKIELVLMRSLDGGARQHVWFSNDPRPHNHPWEWIDCKVLRGQYTAREYFPADILPSKYSECDTTLKAGQSEHRLMHNEYHQIVSLIPGTVTIMSFGPVVGDGKQWGHLVKSTDGVYCHDSNTNQEGYLDAMRHLNPHMRPAGWNDPYSDLPLPTVDELLISVGL